MGGLSEALHDPARRDAVIADCAALVDAEVSGTRGLSGATLKAGYAAFQRIAPGIVPAALTRLLPRFVPALEPHWDTAVASGAPQQYFDERQGEVADALLGVTDELALRSSNRVLVRLYRSLRKRARKHVMAAVPRLPALIAAHVA